MPITWQEAERLRPRLRPRIFRSGRGFQAVGQLNLFDRRRSPNRERSIMRRRRLAFSGPLPPNLAQHFTVGELATLRIVGDECRDKGRCVEFIDAIAARAGVSRSTVKRALRVARDLGLVVVTERRTFAGGHGKPPRNDSNRITLLSREWIAWLYRGRKSAVQIGSSTDSRQKKEALRVEIRKDYASPVDLSG